MTSAGFRMLPSRLRGIEAVQASTRHSFARHCHEQYGIGLVCAGAQKSLSGVGMVEAAAGDCITVNPGEVHDGAPLGGGSRTWQMLYLAPDLVAALTADLGTGTYAFTRPVFRREGSAANFGRLFADVAGAPEQGDRLLHEELLLRLLAQAAAGMPVAAQHINVPANILHARCMIDDDPAADIGLADLAQICGLSRFQLLRAFARGTGMTPHAYRIQRRIDLARGMIAQGLPLAEAAAASGFADQSHMTRVFVRKYGISPYAWAAART